MQTEAVHDRTTEPFSMMPRDMTLTLVDQAPANRVVGADNYFHQNCYIVYTHHVFQNGAEVFWSLI